MRHSHLVALALALAASPLLARGAPSSPSSGGPVTGGARPSAAPPSVVQGTALLPFVSLVKRPGADPDFVVLHRNPLKVAPGALTDITVVQTIEDGVTIHTAGAR